MPAKARGSVYKLAGGGYGIRYRDEQGQLRRQSPFKSKSAARDWFDTIETPRQHGLPVTVDVTFAELVEVFLQRHAAVRSPRTIRTLQERLRRPVAAYGDTPLRDLERMSGDLADFVAGLPPGFRYQVMSALRQVLAAGVRWGYLTSNPATATGANPMPPARTVRVFTIAEQDALEAELGPRLGSIVAFASRPACVPVSGHGRNGETSTGNDGRSPSAAGKRRAPAGRCRSRLGRSPLSIDSRPGSTRPCSSRCSGRGREPRQLPPARVGVRRRRRRDRDTRQDL